MSTSASSTREPILPRASMPKVSSDFLLVSFWASSGLFQSVGSESLASISFSSSTFVAWSKKAPQILEFGLYVLKVLFCFLEHLENSSVRI
jgi:hypothetical protein